MVRRIAFVMAALAALASRADAGERAAPSAPARLPSGAYLSDPTWVRTLSVAEAAALYPGGARKAHKGDTLFTDCVVSATGALDQCKIDDDVAPELGFSPATLEVLKHFQMNSTTREGRPVEGLRIVLRFSWAPPAAAEPVIQALVLSIPTGLSAGTASAPPPTAPFIIPHPDWIRLATVDELSPLYPAAARANGSPGSAILQCEVAHDGGLTDCVSLTETPSGQGFGEATLKAVRYFKVRSTFADGGSAEGGIILLPLKWQFGP